MPKRIIVCCDGTGNDTRTNKQVWSNVGRIADCIVKDDNQIVGYLDGIGVGQCRVSSTVNMATGYGIDDKILKAYKFICTFYKSGDSVILTGFSRGAFTARCVTAFISDVGILSPKNSNIKNIKKIFVGWKELMNSPKEAEKRRQLFYKYNGKDESRRMIKALALWDTVSSLHFTPSDKSLYLVNTSLPGNVEYVFHALSLEEERRLFLPAIWQGNRPSTVKEIKQCWFRGTHSHVGGSHEQSSFHYANVSLMWMVTQIMKHEIIGLDEDQLKRVIASDGTAKDGWKSRPDLGIADSNTAGWRFLGKATQQPDGRRQQGRGMAECFHWSAVDQQGQIIEPFPPLKAATDLSRLAVEPVRQLEYEAIGWPGRYYQLTDQYTEWPGDPSPTSISQSQIFDLERPCKTGEGYDYLVRDSRFYNVFYLQRPQDDASRSPLDMEESTSFPAASSSTASSMSSVGPRNVGSSSRTAVIAEDTGYSEYRLVDPSTGYCPTYAERFTTSTTSSFRPNYGMSTTAGTDDPAYANHDSNVPDEQRYPPYQTNYADSPNSEVYDANRDSYYQRSVEDMDIYGTTDDKRQSQAVHASTSTASEQHIFQRDPETTEVYSQDWAVDNRRYEAERYRRSKARTSRRKR
ncbi:hypothetical protein NW768_011111 [Fusarium equiseti]|uniref:T6SS Phospholipase effector Tle1-like catalytic domain-containing protein n=1 Tax=Fusarium equiseti TaxID=61235 RepID=A0ABQ8QYF0_FUSEQ|nr:hypothetical protein NW768_011111 [Fusarium equiseti]